MQCVSSETLAGVWLEVSDDGDFVGKYMALPSDELDGVNPTHFVSSISSGFGGCVHLLGLICPIEDCLEDGQFDGCPPCSGTVQRRALLRSGSGRLAPASPTL